MKTSMKIGLIIIALVLLAGLIVLRSRPDNPVAATGSDMSRGPSFEVRVDVPRIARPLFGILPTRLEEKLLGVPQLRFDHTSPGAKIGSVEHDRLELSADGWNLYIETDGEGKVSPETRIVFPFGNNQVRLRCRPADRATGYLRTTTRAGSDDLDGRFLVEIATCNNDATGKPFEWPQAPLTVHGTFAGLAHGRR